ncbi:MULTISPECIES: TAXI family TRAP transporter solute-binding subunit [unclassified Haematobacter]|uniref:TAXI family TRAP transporter solute-binding subunit n=1 Tax=unclassified Haematobacter TaxID=2640585 RepID=UPI0025C54247|nr:MULTISPECIES: TAXI family TRAP transporter solute-binding subunit [unclassified Haematobacter]
MRRGLPALLAAILTVSLAVTLTGGIASAGTPFTITTGEEGGSYYPIGQTIATAVSGPETEADCPDPMDCGVPGTSVEATTSTGSVANVEALASGKANSGIVQSDVATWAETGTGLWEGRQAATNLRAIATLHSESIHLVTRADSGIRSPADLKGRRVSPGESGSGTAFDAQLVLSAWDVPQEEVTLTPMAARDAAAQLAAGELDAFFFVGGFPAPFIAALAEKTPLALVPLEGFPAEALAVDLGFLGEGVIPGGTYAGVEEDTPTLALGAVWVTRAEEPEELVYALTRALWNDRTRTALDKGPPQGADISIETALDMLQIPLHPGAERYYREAGLLE